MRLGVIAAGLVCCQVFFGQMPEPATLPRQTLDRARQSQEDALDEIILSRTLYGVVRVEDLTEEQGREMVAAAGRILARSQARLDEVRRLVEEGVLPRLALSDYAAEVERSQKTLELARARAALLEELVEYARLEAEAEALAKSGDGVGPLAERYHGSGQFRDGELKIVAAAFQKQFSKPLPISAHGATAVHRRMGFDHRGRVDVALDPDQPEGAWLRTFLQRMRIPYFAFRSAVPGRSTGPHIHIGPPSERIARGG